MKTTRHLPKQCSLTELHDWIVDNEYSMWIRLAQLGVRASYLVRDIRDCPNTQATREAWSGKRPFPSDVQLVLMLTMFCPDRRLALMDEEAIFCVMATLDILSLPGSTSDSVQVDFVSRTFQMGESTKLCLTS